MTTIKQLSLAIIIFLLGFIFTFVFFMKFNMQLITDNISNIDLLLVNQSFFYIFSNNLLICCIFIIGAGVITIPLLFFQGILFGLFFGTCIYLGIGITNIVLLTFPHAIFEIPAMFWSSLIGLQLFFYLKNRIKSEKLNIKLFFIERKYKLIGIFILIFLGAFVESFVTLIIHERVIQYVG